MTTGGDPDWPALDGLRERIVGVDAEMAQLLSRRQSLVEEYERHRSAIIGRSSAVPMAAAPPPRQEWSGTRVRGLLLGLGAALLGISALTFTAVAWSMLGDGGRALLLVATTAVVTGLALTLRRRLPMTAEAFAGLAIVLVLVDAYALRRAGLSSGMSWQVWWAAGTAVAAAFAALLGLTVGRRTTRFAVAALLPIAPELLALRLADTEWAAALVLACVAAAVVYGLTRWARHLYREDRFILWLHACVSWLTATFLAASAASQPQTVGAAVAPAVAVAALAAAPELARRVLVGGPARTGAAALAAGVPTGVVLTLLTPVLSDDGVLTTAVVAGCVTILAGGFLPGTSRRGALIAGAAFALPGSLWALSTALPAVWGPLAWLTEAWTGSLGRAAREAYLGSATGSPLQGSWAAVGALVAAAGAGLARGWLNRWMLVLASSAIGFAAALAPVTAGASVGVTLAVTTGVAILLVLAAARADRAGLLPGAAVATVPTIGWAAVSPAASILTLAVATVAAVAAALIARTPSARAAYAGLAGLLAVAFVGVAVRAAGADLPAAGFASAVAAGAVALFALFLLRDQPAVDNAAEGLAAVAAAGALAAAAGSTPWLAGTLTVLVPIAAIGALRTERRTLYGSAAGALALAAVWAWLSAAHVSIVEAYTAPAALVALVAGIVTWRSGPGRSWLTLGPALVLAIGPTLVLGMGLAIGPGAGKEDVPRLIVAAILSLAAVIAGAVLRLQAPLCLGAAALLALAIDQWGEEIVRMPRWISVGVVGVLLMWIGATFESRRRDWRRASEVVSRFG